MAGGIYDSQNFEPVLAGIFLYSGQLGVIYDSQATKRSALEGVGVLAGSPPWFLLNIWESNTTPSHTATHFFL
jgi:hypothetical protein